MDLQKYEGMKDNGASPEDVYLRALNDESNKIKAIKLIRQLFDLSLTEAKTVTHNAYAQEQGISRDEYYQELADTIEKVVTEIEQDELNS